MSDVINGGDDLGANPAGSEAPAEKKRSKRVPIIIGVGVAVLGAIGYLGWDFIKLAVIPDEPVSLALPKATPVSGPAGSDVFTIDPTKSKATVSIKENLAGSDKTAVLSTQGIAGQFAINTADLSKSAVGEIKVNVEQLKSDNSLRDKAIRHSYLDSSDHPLVTLANTKVSGLTGKLEDGKSYDFTLQGDLTVKKATKPVKWNATAAVKNGVLTADVTANLSMTQFGVGPLSKAGFVLTEDGAALKLHLVARPAKDYTAPAQLTLAAAKVETKAGGPSFKNDVAPIFEQNCVSCHKGDGIGTHSASLETAGDAAEIATGLALVTESGYMPPWPASSKSVEMRHPRKLTDAQIGTIREWADAGGKLDVDEKSELQNTNNVDVTLKQVDQTLKLAEPYAGDPEIKDDYRCFILDPKQTEMKAMIGSQFIPDKREVVHHVLTYKMDRTIRAAADAADAADAGPGWSCVGAGSSGPIQGELVGGWVPGQRPQVSEGPVGFLFAPGQFLVTQIHYHYNGFKVFDQSEMQIDWADDPSKITPLETRTLVGPVEIPCPAGTNAPLCDRAASIADVAKRFGPQGPFIANGTNFLCRTNPEDVAANSDGVTGTTTCNYKVHTPGEIVDVLGHMHELGSTYRMTLNPGTPEEKILLDIPHWDFAWQLNYQPVDPVAIKQGDVIRVECVWDRRLRGDAEPRYLVFAEGTQDEMCFSTYTIKPT